MNITNIFYVDDFDPPVRLWRTFSSPTTDDTTREMCVWSQGRGSSARFAATYGREPYDCGCATAKSAMRNAIY